MSFAAEELYEAMTLATHSWLAFATCGCPVFSLLDLDRTRQMRAQTAAHVGELRRAGRRVERVPRETAEATPTGCRCTLPTPHHRRPPHRAGLHPEAARVRKAS